MKRIQQFAMIFLLVIGNTAAFAQDQTKREAMAEKIHTMKVSFLTEKLSLSAEEAEAFWPVYNAYEAELKATRPENEQKPDFANMSDIELDRFVQARFAQEQSKLNIKKKYYPKFVQVLSIQKVVLLYESEQNFRKQLLKKIKEKTNSVPAAG